MQIKAKVRVTRIETAYVEIDDNGDPVSTFPQVPQHISSNGQEIWDWAAKLAQVSSLLEEKRQLTRKIEDIGRRCGSCHFWMTEKCPHEKNVNGRKSGPSMSDRVCGKFEMKAHSRELQTEWRAKLKQIEMTLEQKGGEND
jgi:hypothetical protein